MDDEKQEWPEVQIATLTQQMRSAAPIWKPWLHMR